MGVRLKRKGTGVRSVKRKVRIRPQLGKATETEISMVKTESKPL